MEETVPILSNGKQPHLDESKDQSDGTEDTEEETEEGGCQAWVVVVASFFCNMVLDGLGYSFGVLMHPIQEEFQAGSGTVAFVGSILAGVIMLTGPIAAFAVNRLGTRITCMTGATVATLAIFTSSFSPSLLFLVISYGVVGGLGLGCMYIPAMVAVGQYFKKKFTFATGICVCGSGFGTFVFAPIAAALVESMGWRGCNRVMSILCSLGLLCGLALVPVKKSPLRTSQRQEGDGGSMLDIISNPAMALVMLGNIPAPMGIYISYTYLPSIGQYLGFSPSQASLVISVVGISNTVGRIASGWITDRPEVSAVGITIVASMVGSIFPSLIPSTGSYITLVTVSAVFGLIISAIPTVTTKLLVDIHGINNLNSSFGVLTFIRGIAALLGPPIAGFVLDSLQEQAAPFYLATILFASSGLIHVFVWILLRRTQRMRSGYTEI